MRLKKILIKNFRNYKEEQIFDLSKSITILYGENGNGKSSFFDAIEWCLTGKIARFGLGGANKEIIGNKFMVNKEECTVEVYFDIYKIKRTFRFVENSYNNTEISLYILKENEKNYEKIASGETSVAKRLSNIVTNGKIENNKNWSNDILSKAYILSQDQVTDFLSKDSGSSRYNALASIMGFEKVNTFRNNLLKSKEVLLNIKEKKTTEINNIRERLIDKNNLVTKNIEDLGLDFDIIHNTTNIEAISNELTKLKKDIAECEKEKKLITLNYEKDFSLDVEESFINHQEKIKKLISKSEKTFQIKMKKKLQTEESIKEQNKLFKKVENENKIVMGNNTLNKELQKHIDSLYEIDIKYDENLISEVKNEVNQLKIQMNKMYFALDKREELFKLIKIVNNKNEIQLKYLTNIQKIDEELKENLNRLNNLNKEFLKGDVLDNIQELIKLVEDAKSYVTNEHDHTDICPVCNSKVSKLPEIIDNNLKSIISQTGTYQKQIATSISNKNELEFNISQLKKRKSDLLSNKNKQDKLIEKSEMDIEQIKNNNLFITKYFDSKDIALKISEANQQLKKFNNIIQHVEEINKLKSQIVGEEKFDLLQIDINVLKNEIFNKKQEIYKLEQELIDEMNGIDMLKKNYNEITERVNLYKNLFNKHNVKSLTALADLLNKDQKKLLKNEKKLEIQLKNLHEISSLQSIYAEVKKTDELIVIKESNVSKISEKIIKVEELIHVINEQYGDKADSFLNDSKSPIQRYYSYLNPNPVDFNKLNFVIQGNKELDIEIKDDNHSNSNKANFLLSSGQLNVLAISIFIATNTAQTLSYFDFIAIDDPIQNMDDVNKFSITDVLSSLNQQLIFSTHDIDYVNLFMKKNESRAHDIAIYALDSKKNKYENIIDYQY